nr:hypothetical protein [Alphaproteobacteria bacterium]
ELINAIDSKLAKVHTQSLDLSFNEILDMYKNKELDINPDYQRLFQWLLPIIQKRIYLNIGRSEPLKSFFSAAQ